MSAFAESDDEEQEDAAAQHFLPETAAVIHGFFEKFDKNNNGWLYVEEVPKIIESLCGYRRPPKDLAQQAITAVTDYRAVDSKEFTKIYLEFCYLEREDMEDR